MSIPPYPEANSFGTRDDQPTGTRVPIKYIWPKRIAVILAGLAVVGGIGFGAKTLLQSDDSASASQETVQSASPAPAPSQAPQSPAPAASQAPTAPMTCRVPRPSRHCSTCFEISAGSEARSTGESAS